MPREYTRFITANDTALLLIDYAAMMSGAFDGAAIPADAQPRRRSAPESGAERVD